MRDPFVRARTVSARWSRRTFPERGGNRVEGGGGDGNADHGNGVVGFHSRANRCASAIWLGVILAANLSISVLATGASERDLACNPLAPTRKASEGLRSRSLQMSVEFLRTGLPCESVGERARCLGIVAE